MPGSKVRYGSDLIVDLLHLYDIPYVSLNPGSSFRGLHDSLVNYGDNKPEMITCQHEEIAVGIAHGYAKATGKPMAAILHNVVGLLHGAMAIYYAYLDRVPVLILGAGGPMDVGRRRPRIDWIHTALVQGNAVRDYVKWDNQPIGAAAVPDTFARGYRVMMTQPQGPVYLCYDAGFQEDPLEEEVEMPTKARPFTHTLIQGDPAALRQAAELLVEAEHPVIIADYLGRNPDAFHALVSLAERLAIPVIDSNARLNFPNRHPLNLSYVPGVLEEADLVLSLDVRDLYGPLTRLDKVTRRTEYITPPNCKFVEIGLGDIEISKWSQDFQKFIQTDISILADTALAVPELQRQAEAVLARSNGREARLKERAAQIAARHEAAWKQWREDAKADWDQSPIGLGRLAAEVWEVIKDEDWVLTANTLEEWALKTWDFDKPYRHPGKALGTATQIGISLGVALAHRGTGKLVVDIQPDGDLMFDAGALWIAAHDRIPLLVVMYNNRAYYNDWEHQIRMAQQRGTDEARAYIGMEIGRPAPDFATLAKAMGWYAEGPIENPNDIRAAVERAKRVVLDEGRPALVDTITQFR
ncbi:MAG TPA: thiamine pyrophosphate-binding protein [Chloroflexota bacterium]|nr:thiamine pyrophosphate-binding protein [Chloroflexota bacterium]